jgi:hypothetical protein
MERTKKLLLAQARRQHCYDAYQRGEIDQKEYLSRIYPLDIMIERLELSIFLCHVSISWKKDRKDML